MERPLYQELARLVQARRTCKDSNPEWFGKHTETISHLLKNNLPSDWDLDLDESHADKLVFFGDYHHMNEVGYWDGYTDHTVIVKPSLQFDFSLRITGHNRNDVKEDLYQQFDAALRKDVTYDLYVPYYREFGVTSKWEDKDGTPSQCYQTWYCSDGTRFWNDLASAKKHAGQQAVNAFMSRK